MKRFLPEQQRRFTITSLTGVLIVVLFMLYGYWNIQQDDSYIFFSYAQNLANGEGYIFNPGERVNATTSPLYTVLLALLYTVFRFIPFVTIPLIGHTIGAISLFLLSFFLMQSFSSEKPTLFPFVLPLVFLTSPLLPRGTGMEAFLTMMLAVMCLYYYMRGRLLAASLACSFAVLARPDMLLMAGVLLIYDIIRNRRLPRISMAVAFLLPILAWMAFSLSYFGTPLPSTLSAKLAQVDVGFWGTGLVFFKGLMTGYMWYGGPVLGAAVAAAVFLGIIVWRAMYKDWSLFRNPVFHVIILWSVLYLVFYGLVLNTPAYSWYYTPLALGTGLLIAVVVEAIYRYLSNISTVRSRVLIPAIYILVISAGLFLPVMTAFMPMEAKYETYKLAAEWLNKNVEEGSSVAASDIGVLRFYYERGRVICAVGLVNPEGIDLMREGDLYWYIDRHHPDYLMYSHPPRYENEALVGLDWFQKEYSLWKVIQTRRKAVGIYKR
ncbi:MAG: hypothetical protein WBH55_07145, partial [Bacteroidota bacterium]